MCHAFLDEAKFYQLPFQIDQEIAADVRSGGCPTVAVCCIARAIPVSLEVSAVLGTRRMSTG